ncbi:MAG: right-handed parallel beta-helix repeat-containing protein [Planctomycetota bacterium]
MEIEVTIASGERHATLFDTTGAGDNIDLGTLGGDESWASSINNSSQIVGTAYRLFTTTGGRLPPVTSSYLRATLFDATGQGNNIDLGTLLYTYGICCCSGAMSINDSGQIVGAAWNVNLFPVVKTMAVLFDPTGGENNIFLSSPAEHYSFAYSINNRAQIIGWGGLCSNNPCGTGPVLFDPAGQGNNVNLYDLIDPCCGWILKEVWSINDSGWIVGEGINPAGRHHAFLMKPIPPKTIYVDDDASGANDGSSWADAYNYLQDALAAAWSGDEIHVAQGIYKPDQGAGITPGDREATFQLINGVTIEGGYAGTGTLDPNARDIQLYETILNGDLDGNDIIDVNYPWGLWNEPTRAENSYHVVTGTGTDQTPVLDGFTITAGNANATWPDNHGGGMYNFDCSPTLIKCTFNSNSAYMGAAMVNYHSSPTIIDCTFNENESGGGSGMVNKYSSPTVINCTFSGNSGHGTSTSTAGVGGMYNYKSSPTITNCTFSGNFGGEGAMYNDSSNPMITNCTFSGNYSGGMVNSESSPILTNCTFSGNTAIWSGAGIYNYYNSQPTLTNCILWNDSNEIWNGNDSTITITYSDVQGGWPGQGNIDAAPLFVDPGYWEDPCNTPDTPWDDVWIDGDYHLLLGSPCIDAGDPNYVAGPNETDLDGRPRVINGRIDMGAYELPIFAESRILPRTINLTSKGKFVTCHIWLPDDYDAFCLSGKSKLGNSQSMSTSKLRRLRLTAKRSRVFLTLVALS